MRKQPQAYSDEVWFYVKTIYERVDISIANILRMLAAETDLPVPTKQAVDKRIQRGKWVKSARKINNSDWALRRAKSVLSEIKIVDQTDSHVVVLDNDKEVFLANNNLRLLNKIEYKDRNSRTVIIEHRRRSGRIGTIFDVLQERFVALNEDNNRALDAIKQAREDLEKVEHSAFMFDDPDDAAFKKDEAEKKIAKMLEDKSFIASEIGMLGAQFEIIESQSRTAGNLAKLDFGLFGITPDDTKEAQSGNRVAALKDDTLYDAEIEHLKLQCLDMSKRAGWIQSGQLEEEVQAHAEAVMKQQEVEDAEYFGNQDGEEIYD